MEGKQNVTLSVRRDTCAAANNGGTEECIIVYIFINEFAWFPESSGGLIW